MFIELETIRKKYGARGILFLPDWLEIVIERVEMPCYDRHQLACKEDFHRLFDQVRVRAVEDAIQFLESFGFPPEHIT